MQKRFFAFLLLGAALLLTGAGCATTKAPTAQSNSAGNQGSVAGTEAAAVTLTITTDAGSAKQYTVDALQELTVFGLLNEAARANGFALDYDNSPRFGVFVKGINGTANTNERYWQFYVNGVYGEVAANKAPVKPGDQVEWKYAGPYTIP